MENTDDLKQLIQKVAEKESFSPLLIEKDFHLTRILHKVSELNDTNLVFKGGTCLNKCYIGFYRLSEDLDFIFNKNIENYSQKEVRELLDNLRREFFKIIGSLGLKLNKSLGEGWKMITAKIPQKFIGLEITAAYTSMVNNEEQKIKLEISFRKRLSLPAKMQKIKHEFYNELNEPVLPINVEIYCIDLKENVAEKFRALVTRKKIAARDLFDIYVILKTSQVVLDKSLTGLILTKINESRVMAEKEFEDFMNNLSADSLNEEELKSVVRLNEAIDLKNITHLIKEYMKAAKQR